MPSWKRDEKNFLLFAESSMAYIGCFFQRRTSNLNTKFPFIGKCENMHNRFPSTLLFSTFHFPLSFGIIIYHAGKTELLNSRRTRSGGAWENNRSWCIIRAHRGFFFHSFFHFLESLPMFSALFSCDSISYFQLLRWFFIYIFYQLCINKVPRQQRHLLIFFGTLCLSTAQFLSLAIYQRFFAHLRH